MLPNSGTSGRNPLWPAFLGKGIACIRVDTLTLFLIALGLAMDASAVALGVGCVFERLSFRPIFRLSFHFGLFQALMAVIGWFAGSTIEPHIAAFDHWLAFALLAYVGINMIRASLAGDESRQITRDPTRGRQLAALSVATSIDALAVGISLGMLGVSIWYPSLIIGLVAAGCTVLGMFVGQRCGAAVGRRMELAGGLVLILIGVRIVYTHLA